MHLLSESRGSALETGTISRIKMVSSLKDMSEVWRFSFVHCPLLATPYQQCSIVSIVLSVGTLHSSLLVMLFGPAD